MKLTTASQLTIRGIDPTTKAALVKQASSRGMSLNRYALQALRGKAGTDTPDSRYQQLRAFLEKSPISPEDSKAFDEAIAWSDGASAEKQRRDETNDAGI